MDKTTVPPAFFVTFNEDQKTLKLHVNMDMLPDEIVRALMDKFTKIAKYGKELDDAIEKLTKLDPALFGPSFSLEELEEFRHTLRGVTAAAKELAKKKTSEGENQ